MDPRHVLVADPLDVMPAIAVVEQRRALDRLQADDLVLRPDLLEPVACGDGSGAAHRRYKGADSTLADPFRCQLSSQLDNGVAGHVVVKAIIAHHLKLVEDTYVGIRPAQFPGLVVDLLDIALAARGLDHLRTIGFDQIKALLAHLCGQNNNTSISHAPADPGPADPVVAR